MGREDGQNASRLSNFAFGPDAQELNRTDMDALYLEIGGRTPLSVRRTLWRRGSPEGGRFVHKDGRPC